MTNLSLKKSHYDKLYAAKSVIDSCKSDLGFYASADLYKHECWTRDLSYCLEGLLAAGYENDVKKALKTLWEKQKSSGRVPTLFFDNFTSWLRNSIRRGRAKSIPKSFTGLEAVLNSIFHVSDPTPHAVITTYELARSSKDENFISNFSINLKSALEYIEKNCRDGFIVGCDWRDLMPELRGDALLSNQCLLYRIYRLAGEERKAEDLKNRINNEFWNGEYYVSSRGRKDFDMLGNALAIEWDIAKKDTYGKLAEMFRKSTTKYGIRNMLLIDKRSANQKTKVPECDQYGTIWPFAAYHAVLALDKMGYRDFAREEFEKLENLEGFNEWYDPSSGKPLGSKEQLWNAASYLETVKKIF